MSELFIVKNTQRLSFELMSDKDAQLFFDLDQDPEVMRFINGGKPSTMEEIHSVYLPRLRSYTDLKKGWGMWKVTLTQTDEFLGWVLVRPMNFFSEQPDFGNLELGWRFKRIFWGKGYASEAARAIKDELLSRGGISQLTAVILKGNESSVGVSKKLGMKYLKTDIHKDPLGDHEALYYEYKVDK